MAELVYRPVVAAGRLLFRLQGLRFRVEGAENVPATGGAVMAINHIGYLDFTFAGYAALPAGRLVRFMAKQEVFSHPISGPLMRGMHHIPVDRAAGGGVVPGGAAGVAGRRDRRRLPGSDPQPVVRAQGVQARRGSDGDGRPRVPLLPTVVWGSQRVWTKDRPRRLVRPRVPISVYVGEPVAAPRDTGADVAGVLHQRMEDAAAPRPGGVR